LHFPEAASTRFQHVPRGGNHREVPHVDWSLTAGLVGGTALVSSALLGSRLLRYRAGSGEDEPSEEGFSFDRYAPMTRLATDEDLVYLAAQPGYRPEIGSRLRRDRRRIFGMYLHALAHDFHRWHSMAWRRATKSQEQEARLLRLLMRQELTFWRAVVTIEVRLLLPKTELSHVDVRGLMRSMAAMRRELAGIEVSKMSYVGR
jgi:hypothetical protein